MSGFSIRRGEPADAASLFMLAAAVAAEPEGWLLAQGPWRSEEDERRALQAQRWTDDFVLLVAADAQGVPIGRLSLVRDEHPAAAHVADLGILVAREWRGRGVGTALVEAGAAWALEAGYGKLELHVLPGNVRAIGVYERCGFVRKGLRRQRFLRGGEAVDVLLMGRLLQEGLRAYPDAYPPVPQ